MQEFYAKYDDPYGDVAVFSTEEQRDDWVNYKDPFSLLFPEMYDGKRIALTQEQAEALTGPKLYDPNARIEDFDFGNYFWVEAEDTVPGAEVYISMLLEQ